jgi:hypothetical protein
MLAVDSPASKRTIKLLKDSTKITSAILAEGLFHRSLGHRPRVENVILRLAEGHIHPVRQFWDYGQNEKVAFKPIPKPHTTLS